MCPISVGLEYLVISAYASKGKNANLEKQTFFPSAQLILIILFCLKKYYLYSDFFS